MDSIKKIKYFLEASAVFSGAMLCRSVYECHTLTKAEYEIHTEKKLKRNRTVIFLSDIHDAVFGKDNRILKKMIHESYPDAILIGGDCMTAKRSVDILPTMRLCEYLCRDYPVYYGNGNHEMRLRDNPVRYHNSYAVLEDKLKKAGVHFLSDSSAMLDGDIRITGLDIDKRYYRNGRCENMNSSYISGRVGFADSRHFQILLAHSPLFLDAYEDWGADLALAGHFHGGTIRLHDGIGLMTPQFQLFNRFVTGIHQKNNTSLIISSGLGTHTINIRLHNKPQVVVVHIKK